MTSEAGVEEEKTDAAGTADHTGASGAQTGTSGSLENAVEAGSGEPDGSYVDASGSGKSGNPSAAAEGMQTDSSSAIVSGSGNAAGAGNADGKPEAQEDEDADPNELSGAAATKTDFVTSLYRTMLGREPDAAGLADWVARLNGGLTGSDCVAGFFFSDEFQKAGLSDEEFVKRMYRAIFDREADAGGLKTWTGYLADGCTRKIVLQGFLGSKEFSDLCKTISIRTGTWVDDANADKNPKLTAFVQRLYQICLGRKGDEGGLNDWTGRLLNGQIGGAEAARGFFFSDEMKNANLSNEAFLQRAYRALLGREPDAPGLADWENRLAAGQTRENVFNGFAFSTEFESICDSYGIAQTTSGGSLRHVIRTSGSFLKNSARRQLEKGIREIENSGADVGFYLVDLKSGQSVEYNADTEFYSASTIKGPYVVSLAAARPDAVSAQEGWMRLTLQYSDNSAYEFLRRTYGSEYLKQWMREAGVSESYANGYYTWYSARTLAKLWERNEKFIDGDSRGAQIGAMLENPNQSCLKPILGQKYKTRTKAGWYPSDGIYTATADAGIIYAGDHPYIVAVMTNVPSYFPRLYSLTWGLDDAHQCMVQG